MSPTLHKTISGQTQKLRHLPNAFALFAAAGGVSLVLSLGAAFSARNVWFGLAAAVVGIAALAFGLYNVKNVKRVIIAVEETERDAFQLAGHDPLSGLPNRRIYKERLESEISRIRRGEHGLAVLFLDLDKFKEVNDTFGHAGGDMLIVQFAERMNDLLRGADTLARLGGDEFAIIQTDVRHLQDVEALARRILAATKEAFPLPGGTAFVGVSIGIALAPEHSDAADMLMKLADVSLYQSKNDGRNRYSIFARQLGDQLRLRKVVEDELRETIESNGLTLAYQPLVDAETCAIQGFEALVRWNHKRLGNVPPSEFIPLAESTGLINSLGAWVLRRACEDALRWPEQHSVSVNVSAIQFKNAEFVATVAAILEETGIAPNRLVLELTESVVVADADAAEAAIMDLRGLGVRIALDDFGTGYSSLIYLRRFAFDKIKIDRSFLDTLESTGESAILVHSVVHLGRALGLTVVAEGVETAEQYRMMQAVGCHLLQGYYFGKPVNQKQTLALIEKSKKTGGCLSAAA